MTDVGDEFRQEREWGKIAFAGVAALVVLFLAWKGCNLVRGAHLEFAGSLLKVRTLYTDDTHSIAVIDFEATNKADYPFTVRKIDVSVVTAEGKTVAGTAIADMDANRLFEYYESLGKREHPGLLMKQTVKAHETTQRMVAAQFELPAQELRKYKEFILRFEELDGVATEIRGRAP